MPAPRRRHLRLLAALAALTVVTAACSDNDSTDDPTIQDDGGDGTTDDAGADDGATDEGDADEGDDGGEATGDPCSLLTPAELEEITGSPYDAGSATHQEQSGGDQCTWTNTDAPPVKEISVVVHTSDGLAGSPTGQAAGDAAAYYEGNKAAVTVDEELEIGDEAFRAGSTIWILDGDTVYSVLTLTGTSAEAIATITAVAERLVD